MVIKWFLIILCFSTSTNLFAEPSITEVNNDYYITGSSASELREAMNSNGPLDPNSNKRFDAYTKWQVKWQYGFREKSKNCKIESVKVTVNINFAMPKWPGRESAVPHLRERWDKYINALQNHENGHRDFGVSAAEEIEKAILNLDALSSCKEIGAAANKAAHEIIDHYKAKEVEYDKTTRHGATQGAVFP